MIIINKNSIIKTCFACPSQWEGKTEKQEDVYIRVRHGYFRLDIDGETKFSGKPDGVDGVMSTDEMINYVNKNNFQSICIL